MSPPFTPLVSKFTAPATGPKPSGEFTALGHSHEVGSNPPDASPGVDPTTAPVSVAGTPSDSPQVTLKHEGDRITHVTIHCTCGQVLHLACSY